MRSFLVVFAALSVLGLSQAHKNRAPSPYEDLHRVLFNDYDRDVPPKETANSTMQVNFGLAAIWMNLNAENILEAKMWSRILWNDYRLTWDPKDFGGISVLRVDVSKLWTPDIVLYNKGKNFGKDNMPQKRPGSFCPALIYSDGSMLWVPEIDTTVLCTGLKLDEPWGEQNCTFKIGSWTYDGYNIDLQFYKNKTEIDMTDYSKASPIQVNEQYGVKEVKYYDCCEEPYVSLKMSIKFQRKFVPSADGLGIVKNPRLRDQE